MVCGPNLRVHSFFKEGPRPVLVAPDFWNLPYRDVEPSKGVWN